MIEAAEEEEAPKKRKDTFLIRNENHDLRLCSQPISRAEKQLGEPELRVTVILLAASIVTGCGLTSAQRETIGQFGKSTGTFGATAATQLPAMRAGIRELNAARFMVAPIPTGLTPGEASPSNLTGSISADEIQIRVRVAAALAEYGSVLVDLVNSDDPSKAVAEVNTIGKSLADVPFFANSADRLKTAGSALGSVTGLLLEEYRLRAVRDVVNSADDFIQTAALLFASDFRTRDCAALRCGLALGYRNTAATVGAAAFSQESLLRSRPVASAERRSILDTAALAERHREAAVAISEAGLKAAIEIAAKHGEIKEMLNGPGRATADTSQLVAVVQAFAATALAFRRGD